MPPKKRNAVSPKGNDPKRPALRPDATGPSRPSSPTYSEKAFLDEAGQHISSVFSELAIAIFTYLPENATTLIPRFQAPAARLVQAVDAVRDAMVELDILVPGQTRSAVELWTSYGGVVPSTTTSSALPIPVYGPLLPPDWKGSKFIRRQPVQHTGTQCDTANTIVDEPSRRLYADALIQTTTTTPMAPQRAAKNAQHRAKSVRTREQNSTSSKEKTPAPSPSSPPATSQTSDSTSTATGTSTSTFRTRAYVIHGIQVNRKLWQVREELEKRESRRLGHVEGIRWLLPKKRRSSKDKEASSIVVYLESAKERPPFLWVGHKRHRVDIYDFDRGVRDIVMGDV